jgi:hypothetical protein
VDIGLGVVALLVLLVNDGILGGAGTGADVGVAVLGDVLVGLLGSLGAGALDGLGDVVGGVLMNNVSHELLKRPGLILTNLDGLHYE